MSNGQTDPDPERRTLVDVQKSIHIHTIEEQRQYEYAFDENLTDAAMNDRGHHNWEAVCIMHRDGQDGILYKKTI